MLSTRVEETSFDKFIQVTFYHSFFSCHKKAIVRITHQLFDEVGKVLPTDPIRIWGPLH